MKSVKSYSLIEIIGKYCLRAERLEHHKKCSILAVGYPVFLYNFSVWREMRMFAKIKVSQKKTLGYRQTQTSFLITCFEI